MMMHIGVCFAIVCRPAVAVRIGSLLVVFCTDYHDFVQFCSREGSDQPILVLDAVILSLSNAVVIMGSGSLLVLATYGDRMITNVDSSRQCVFGVVNLGLPCKNVWKCFAADLKFIGISSSISCRPFGFSFDLELWLYAIP
ncbi:hypothetical protein Peur_029343 [Populus x canadensis]